MSKDADGGRTPWGGLAVMALFATWSGLLGIGFAAAAVVAASDGLGVGQLVLYVVLALFLLLAATRTAYELVRRLRARQ